MSCEYCEPILRPIYQRKLNIKDFYRVMTRDLNLNPSFEYEKHPIVAREIEMGIKMIKKRNPDLQLIPIQIDFNDYGDAQVINFCL